MKFIKKHPIIFLVLLLDLIIVILHLTLGGFSSFFHLDFEHNLPTLYQSAKLIAVGAVAAVVIWQLSLMKNLKRADIIFYSLFGAGFVFLGLDELGQLHENVDYFVREVNPGYADAQLELLQSVGYRSSTWMVYYAPIMLAASFYFVYAWKYIKDNIPKVKPAFLTMLVMFSLVIIFEFVSNQGYTDPGLYQIYITIEESAEMLGATAGLAVMLSPFMKNTQKIKKLIVKK